jgi:hypothetical protein
MMTSPVQLFFLSVSWSRHSAGDLLCARHIITRFSAFCKTTGVSIPKRRTKNCCAGWFPRPSHRPYPLHSGSLGRLGSLCHQLSLLSHRIPSPRSFPHSGFCIQFQKPLCHSRPQRCRRLLPSPCILRDTGMDQDSPQYQVWSHVPHSDTATMDFAVPLVEHITCTRKVSSQCTS